MMDDGQQPLDFPPRHNGGVMSLRDAYGVAETAAAPTVYLTIGMLTEGMTARRAVTLQLKARTPVEPKGDAGAPSLPEARQLAVAQRLRALADGWIAATNSAQARVPLAIVLKA